MGVIEQCSSVYVVVCTNLFDIHFSKSVMGVIEGKVSFDQHGMLSFDQLVMLSFDQLVMLSFDQQLWWRFQMINMHCYHSINTQLDGIIWSTLQKWSYHLINIVETKVSNDQQKITTILSYNQHSWNKVIKLPTPYLLNSSIYPSYWIYIRVAAASAVYSIKSPGETVVCM